MLGPTRPGIAPLYPLRRRSKLLFHFRANDLLLGHDPAEEVLQAVTGETPTFTRATAGGYTRGRDGVLLQWATDMPRIEMYDLDGDGVFETPGLLVEGQRTNEVLRSEEIDNAAWGTFGTPIVTANDIQAPDRQKTAEKIEDDDGAVTESKFQDVTIVDDSTTWNASIFIRKTTGTPVVLIQLHMLGGTTTKVAAIVVDPADGDKLIGSSAIDGDVIDYGDWWRVWLSESNNGTGNTTIRLEVFAAGRPSGDVSSTAAVASAQGSNHLWGAQIENAGFPSSYIRTVTGASVRNADALTYGFNWGTVLTTSNDDFTVYAKIPRPIYADLAGSLGGSVNPGFVEIGTALPVLRGYTSLDATRVYQSEVQTAGSDAIKTVSLPAGNLLEVTMQYRNVRISGETAIDPGTGLSTFATGATAFTAFGNTTLALGNHPSTGGRKLFGALTELKVARGLFTFKQMQGLT